MPFIILRNVTGKEQRNRLLAGWKYATKEMCAVLYLVTQLSNSLRPHGLWPAWHLCPWEFTRQEYWSR